MVNILQQKKKNLHIHIHAEEAKWSLLYVSLLSSLFY